MARSPTYRNRAGSRLIEAARVVAGLAPAVGPATPGLIVAGCMVTVTSGPSEGRSAFVRGVTGTIAHVVMGGQETSYPLAMLQLFAQAAATGPEL